MLTPALPKHPENLLFIADMIEAAPLLPRGDEVGFNMGDLATHYEHGGFMACIGGFVARHFWRTTDGTMIQRHQVPLGRQALAANCNNVVDLIADVFGVPIATAIALCEPERSSEMRRYQRGAAIYVLRELAETGEVAWGSALLLYPKLPAHMAPRPRAKLSVVDLAYPHLGETRRVALEEWRGGAHPAPAVTIDDLAMCQIAGVPSEENVFA